MCNEEILKHMEEDMTFRGLTAGTIHSYIMRVKRYMKFHEGKEIEKLTEDDIRDFLKYLTKDTNNARRAINTYNSAIRFMYGTTLNKVLNLKRIPLFKIQKNKPEVFTKDELKRFFEACDDGFYYSLLYKAMFMTAYRYTLLSQKNLEILREYFKAYRPNHPEGYLFVSPMTNAKYGSSGPEIAFRRIRKKECTIFPCCIYNTR